VAVADYVLKHKPGNTVSNLSSTRALKDVTVKYGGSYTASGVGEVNVVEAMKKVSAVIGGEGNGGVILPDLHFGRDALVGIAIFLSQLAEFGGKVSELRKQYPDYYVSKNKVNLSDSFDFDKTKALLMEKFKDAELNTADGLRIDFPEGWVHIRKSNTEPIVRIYAEGLNKEIAEELAGRIMQHL
jgi:phosphomannomutase